jgi:hypothetical protein
VFATRLAEVPAGALTVTVTAGDGADREQSVYDIEYEAVSCTP